jgi:hypothetical protein
METFQITILVVAVVILIIIFSAIGITLKYAILDKTYPPIENTCPENWIVTADRNCTIPLKGAVNSGNLYSGENIYLTNDPADKSGRILTHGYDSAGNFINFSDAGWSSAGKSSVCNKKDWANKNAIEWDGVSNYNACQ